MPRGFNDKEKQIIKTFITSAFELIESNTFIKKLYIENEMETLIRKLPSEKFIEHKKKDSQLLLSIIQKWRVDGIIISTEPEVIVGMLRSIFMISLHKDQIGEQIYSTSLEFLIELLSEGLTRRDDL